MNKGMLAELLIAAVIAAGMIFHNQTLSYLTWKFRWAAPWWAKVAPWIYLAGFIVLWCHFFFGLWAPDWSETGQGVPKL
jgi:hypothetical protein